jgi:hypothetical protein
MIFVYNFVNNDNDVAGGNVIARLRFNLTNGDEVAGGNVIARL